MTLCGGVWIFCGTTQFDFVEGGKVDSELQITFTTGHTCHDAPPSWWLNLSYVGYETKKSH